jgi:MFS family permease
MPPGAAAAMAALHLSDPRTDAIARLSDKDREDALHFACRSQLALFLPRELHPERLAGDAAGNRERLRILLDTYKQVAEILRGIDFVALKGVTQCALFGIDPERRAQYDIDLYCPRETLQQARDALLSAGYEFIRGMESFPTDHLPALVRKTAWEWRHDFFDPEIPLSIELHFRFWNPALERLPAPGAEEFWNRRVKQSVGGVNLRVLAPADALAYAALHLLKHLLQGSVRPFHVYEIASFLHLHAQDTHFWTTWRDLHAPELRRVQAVSFRLAESWFGCALAPAAREEIERLPASALAWFDAFALSPATQRFRPNKDELWLHLALLNSAGDAFSVARRRLFPTNLPPPVKATYLPGSALTFRRRIRLYLDYATYLNARLGYHVVSLGTTLTSGARWWWRTNGLGRDFWLFLAAAVIFNFALFIFFLLYNLYLVDLGYREEFLGTVSAAARAGSLAGTLPAAFLARRLGLKRALIATIGGAAAATMLRAVVATQFPLAALSFIEGAIFAVWAVIMAPCIAGAVDPKRRTTAFSLFFATMFATGIVGNGIGGHLPALLHGKQNTLIFAAALIGVAILPVLRMRTATPPPAVSRARIYPRGRFLLRFLVPFAVWHLATGAFNPFNNVYFSRLKFPVQEIGEIFSISQVVQVVAVLLAPLMIRRFGLVNGIVWMMMATAAGLGALAAQPPAFMAILAYAAYMAFQWMSEPGLNTLVMNQVGEEERSGASSITYLVAFSAQAVAALVAGQLIENFGYPPLLFAAALLALAASFLFRTLPPENKPAS